MKIVVIVYPDDEDVSLATSWAQVQQLEMYEHVAPDYGRRVSMTGTTTPADLLAIVGRIARA